MAHHPKTILHVDDDPALSLLLSKRLAREGYRVVSLHDPSKLIDTLLENHCHVVILDIDMPTASGLDVLSTIKQYDGGIQVLMLTGLVSMNTVLESLRRGAEACLFKPIENIDGLLCALEATFQKLDRYWIALEEMTRLRHQEESLQGV